MPPYLTIIFIINDNSFRHYYPTPSPPINEIRCGTIILPCHAMLVPTTPLPNGHYCLHDTKKKK